MQITACLVCRNAPRALEYFRKCEKSPHTAWKILVQSSTIVKIPETGRKYHVLSKTKYRACYLENNGWTVIGAFYD